MTFVIGTVTREYAVLVADRRLTDSRSGKVVDDNRNKTVVLCGHFLLGYSGLADIASKPTDMWLGELLVGIDPSDYFEAMTSEAGAALRVIRNRVLRRHAFLAVGFVSVRSRPDEGLFPVVVSISNAMNDDLQWLPEAQDHFTVRKFSIPDGSRSQSSWVGQPLTHDEIKQLRRHVDAFAMREPDRPSGLARLLIEQTRQVASRSSAVGRNLLVAALPKTAVPATAYTVSFEAGAGALSLSRLSGDDLRCMFVPDSDDPDQAYFHGPLTLCPGFMTAGAEIWSSKPPWWKDT